MGEVPRAQRLVFHVCAAVAVVIALALAISRRWLCDDAFISFRYADNLVSGHGLVFNIGERVEGETNLLWTLWTALGIELGVSPETWSITWGLACHAATLVLLTRRSWQMAQQTGVRWAFPIAALFAIVHLDWASFATSGLETSAFTLLVLAGYLLVCPVVDPARPARLAAAGTIFALASLARPDGVVFVAVCGLWLLAARNVRGALAFGTGFAVVFGPVLAWRYGYYGDVVPNTYYAKSAAVPWWSQGARYAYLYAQRYWALLLAVPLAVRYRPTRPVVLELALVVAYVIYVTRVGGDFMFARMFVPITPLLALLVERGLIAGAAGRPILRAAATLTILVAIVVTPTPRNLVIPRWGIVDERDAYTRTLRDWADSDRVGATLGRMFEGLPVVVGFLGSEARWVYRSRIPMAIECETGLTDATIARQPLVKRGRIGHEKHAPYWYLRQRRVVFILGDRAGNVLGLDDILPHVSVDLAGVRAQMLYWDPSLVAALRARGATIPDFTAEVDRTIAELPSHDDAEVHRDWEKLDRFYFSHVRDPEREAPFRARLGRPER